MEQLLSKPRLSRVPILHKQQETAVFEKMSKFLALHGNLGDE